VLIARYHCDACGWDGETPALLGEPMSKELLSTLHCCPECGEKVYQTVIVKEGGEAHAP
jgi:predicted RNA-binding Zn-ribbon protein involved in translation (DUF1610 family)